MLLLVALCSAEYDQYHSSITWLAGVVLYVGYDLVTRFVTKDGSENMRSFRADLGSPIWKHWKHLAARKKWPFGSLPREFQTSLESDTRGEPFFSLLSLATRFAEYLNPFLTSQWVQPCTVRFSGATSLFVPPEVRYLSASPGLIEKSGFCNLRNLG
eukprot:Rmarinus@m.20320